MRQSPNKVEATTTTLNGLLDAIFIYEEKYKEWLSNIVLVKKSSTKWRMCVHYINLNRVCPKDYYMFLYIDKLVDNSVMYQLLSFMDAYYGYNQIHMSRIDRIKTTFMNELAN